MYSSSIYTPFPQLTSTIHGFSPPPPPTTFFSPPPDFLQNRQDLLQGFFFPSDAGAPRDNAKAPPQISSEKKKNKNMCKKDRHSKIFTAHGPRDRRVRLSMEIARKFFDLQDMLGFDKASKTLDWLLTNSKESIKELIHMKTKINNINSGCLFEMVYNNNNNNSNDWNEKINERDAFDMRSRESRAKARARARDRTREKMRAKEDESSSLRIINGQDLTTTTSSPNHSSSSRSWPQIDHIPDIWDITTDLIPPELQYNGKPSWDV